MAVPETFWGAEGWMIQLLIIVSYCWGLILLPKEDQKSLLNPLFTWRQESEVETGWYPVINIFILKSGILKDTNVIKRLKIQTRLTWLYHQKFSQKTEPEKHWLYIASGDTHSYSSFLGEEGTLLSKNCTQQTKNTSLRYKEQLQWLVQETIPRTQTLTTTVGPRDRTLPAPI